MTDSGQTWEQASFEERLRVQQEEFERQMLVKIEETTARYEERLRVEKEEHERRMRVQKENITAEFEEQLRVQKDAHQKQLVAQRNEVEDSHHFGYYPLPLSDFPLEIIALIADFVHHFDDLAALMLVCRRVRHGVLLCRRWIVVAEVVSTCRSVAKLKFDQYPRVWANTAEAAAARAAAEPTRTQLRRRLFNRRLCLGFACRNGLVRTLRILKPLRAEVTAKNFSFVTLAIIHERMDVLKFLHTTFKLTPEELSNPRSSDWDGPRLIDPYRVDIPIDMLKYMHKAMGVPVPAITISHAARKGDVEKLKYLHKEVGFTAADFMTAYTALSDSPILLAARAGHEPFLVYLRDSFGVTKNHARVTLGAKHLTRKMRSLIEQIFSLPVVDPL